MKMNAFRMLLMTLAVAGTLCAQKHKLVINAETPEGQLLQQIGQENDAAKKTALMEDYVQKYPKHDGVGWVLDQLLTSYIASSSFDKAIGAGEKLLAMDPSDLVASTNYLKGVVGKKDVDLILKAAPQTSALARKAASATEPADAEEKENWKNSVDYAKQVDIYTEYALYFGALNAADPAKKISMIEALSVQNPKSQYVKDLNVPYFLALRQAGQNDKAIAVAEKTLDVDQSNEDMLLVVADSYFNKKTNPEKVIAYGLKLPEVMASKQKPEGMSDGDWEARKNLLSGLGYWMAGMVYSGQNKLPDTDKTLRQALPLVKQNDQLSAQALFHLAMANYNMGSPKKDKKLMMEALRFNQQCAAIKSPFQATAQKNAAVIKQQYGIK